MKEPPAYHPLGMNIYANPKLSSSGSSVEVQEKGGRYQVPHQLSNSLRCVLGEKNLYILIKQILGPFMYCLYIAA